MRRILCALVLAFTLSAPEWALAAQESVAQPELSNRSTKKLGAYLALGNPSPTLLGINLAYNALDFMRVTAGMGKITVTSGLTLDSSGLTSRESSATTLGAGAQFFVPGWNVSPTAGVNFAHVSYSGDGGLEVGGFTSSGSHVYFTAGVDFQAKSGAHFGLGINQSLRSDTGRSLFLSAGWFFDLFGSASGGGSQG